MNKQELIERIKGLKNLFGNKSEYVEIDTVIRIISELDEPKVTIPQFVANWIEKCKTFEELVSLSCALNPNVWEINNLSDECIYWLKNFTNQELLARAWLYGYEIEKEKRYHVRFKGMESDDFNYLNFIKFQRAWVLSSIKLDKKFRTEHTRKELEDAGFGWVFDCPGVEVKEVEE